MNDNKLTYADLFSGCGGLSYGFHRNKEYNGLLSVDNWKAAGEVYKQNYPDVPFFLLDLSDEESRRSVISRLSGTCDIVVGGPPCQGFSTLGKRKENCLKSTLVDTFIEMSLLSNPSIILMENVRGFQSKRHPSGQLYPEHIKQLLEDTKNTNRYNYHEFLLNTLDYGIPQTRLRYILFAVREDIEKEKNVIHKFIQSLEQHKSKKQKVLADVIRDLPSIGPGEGDQELFLKNGRRVFNHQAMNHSKDLIARLKKVPAGGGLLDVPNNLLTPHLIRMKKGAYGNGGHIKNIYGRLSWDKPCGTIVAGMDKITCGRYVHPDEHRLLTPRECARIQSFPDGFKFSGGLVTQYYLIGNSVPPKISQVLTSSIMNSLRG